VVELKKRRIHDLPMTLNTRHLAMIFLWFYVLMII